MFVAVAVGEQLPGSGNDIRQRDNQRLAVNRVLAHTIDSTLSLCTLFRENRDDLDDPAVHYGPDKHIHIQIQGRITPSSLELEFDFIESESNKFLILSN